MHIFYTAVHTLHVGNMVINMDPMLGELVGDADSFVELVYENPCLYVDPCGGTTTKLFVITIAKL